MFILIRKIVAHTDNNIILGVFTEVQKAKDALSKYRNNYLEFPELDPWRKQAYVSENLSIDNFKISRIENKDITGPIVYLTTKHKEGFGQVTAEIDSLHNDKKLVESYCLEAEANEVDMDYPAYYTYQKLIIDELSTDEEA